MFGFVSVHERPLADGIAAESGWMASAARTGRAAAHLWRGEPGLVVPRSCTTLPGWPAAAQAHRVRVRASGGGVVPQGPGLLNLSLVWRADTGATAGAPSGTEVIYRALCEGLASALARLGVVAAPRAVRGRSATAVSIWPWPAASWWAPRSRGAAWPARRWCWPMR